ncbi:MAG: DUF1552 domain-containing protein [Nannocystales bacterium]
MKRRTFVFRSLKAAALLTPVLSIRRAEAREFPTMRGLVWVNSTGYPYAEDFFPGGDPNNFTLSPILSDFESVRDEIVVVDGISIRSSGPAPRGNNHVRAPGKVLTAKDIVQVPGAEDGTPGGASIDQWVAGELGLQTVELQVNNGGSNNHMRHRPFASGPGAFKAPVDNPQSAWNLLFSGFDPTSTPESIEATKRRLRMRKSVLDDVTDELSRFRSELTGVETLKLDIHEDAIRKAEESVARDLELEPVSCTVPGQPDGSTSVPDRAQAQFDLAYAALACGRADLIGMIWGFSGQHWRYEWAGVTNVADSGHDEVHHLPGARRDDYIRMARWDWNHLRAFIERLRDTPDGASTMLDSTLIMGLSFFGVHHQLERIPVMFAGGSASGLETGRAVRLVEPRFNDTVLTSFAHLMGAPSLTGFGDDTACGPVPGL